MMLLELDERLLQITVPIPGGKSSKLEDGSLEGIAPGLLDDDERAIPG